MVDDEEDQIFGVKIALEDSYGDEYEVIPAHNGAECFELLKNNEKPDLILLDIMMPEMTGWETYDRIKENKSWRKIPIVFLTARKDRIDKDAGDFLAEDYIEKPAKIPELKQRLDNILKK